MANTSKDYQYQQTSVYLTSLFIIAS